MHDHCPIKKFDHIEFYVGNARQASHYYANAFGFNVTAYSGLETGNREAASYVMEQGGIRFVFTTALGPEHAVSQSVLAHGDGVAIIGLEVPDAFAAYTESTKRGALGAIAPTEESDEDGVLRYSAIHTYGDTLIKFVERSDYHGPFAPGFEARSPTHPNGIGLTSIDHVVGNVELGAMDKWVQFFGEALGFSQLMHFDDKAISTDYSALMSKVMQDGTGKIKFPINEPAKGKRKSQIEEYLEYNLGPGVQHIAMATTDIIKTVTALKEDGVEFLRVPMTYYDDLEARIGKIDEPIDELAELGILADCDEDGYLLQIFTLPVQDRPTVFFEVIERHGAQGFGAGNFKSLFEAIEREQAQRGNL